MEGQIGEKKIEDERSGGTNRGEKYRRQLGVEGQIGEKKIEDERSGGTDRGEKDRGREEWRDR